LKKEIHQRLKDIKNTTAITEDEFIQVYGNDQKRMHKTLDGLKEMSRADILAQAYGLTVEKQGKVYRFTK
jgi:hypothetical protein